MIRKKLLTRIRQRYEVIETGGMVVKNAPPPPKPVSKRPELPLKRTKS